VDALSAKTIGEVGRLKKDLAFAPAVDPKISSVDCDDAVFGSKSIAVSSSF
jgi:hypothetical protein